MMSKDVEVVLSQSKCVYKWEIENFSTLSSTMRTGAVYKSKKFTSAGPTSLHDWQLALYATGGTQEAFEYAGLFLNFIGNGETIEAEYNLIIFSGNNKFELTPRKNIFKCNDRGWGLAKFIKRSIIMNKSSGILDGDKLIIYCEICISSESDNKLKSIFWPEPPNYSGHLKVLDDFEKLLVDDEFSDVKFLVDDKTLHAHKNILSRRSPVFAAMFKHDMKESNENVVKIEDITFRVFREMLRFIYSYKVQEIDGIAEELLAVAEKYDLGSLKILSAASLCTRISVTNALEYLRLADLYHVEELKMKVKQFIATHAEELVVNPEFKAIVTLHPDLAIEVCQSLVLKK